MKERPVTKCYHCGKIHELDKKSVSTVIRCSHCHSAMKLDKKSERRYSMVRYCFVLFLCMILTTVLITILKNSVLTMMMSMAAAMLLTLYTEKFCLRLTYSLFGLTYEEYHPEEVAKLEKEEEREKEKKKRLKQAARAEKRRK